MAQPAHIASDDALYFLNSSLGTDRFDYSEDPNGKRAASPFKHHHAIVSTGRQQTTSLEPGPVPNLTPGARRIP